jgi:hypothetical protein
MTRAGALQHDALARVYYEISILFSERIGKSAPVFALNFPSSDLRPLRPGLIGQPLIGLVSLSSPRSSSYPRALATDFHSVAEFSAPA